MSDAKPSAAETMYAIEEEDTPSPPQGGGGQDKYRISVEMVQQTFEHWGNLSPPQQLRARVAAIAERRQAAEAARARVAAIAERRQAAEAARASAVQANIEARAAAARIPQPPEYPPWEESQETIQARENRMRPWRQDQAAKRLRRALESQATASGAAAEAVGQTRTKSPESDPPPLISSPASDSPSDQD